MALTKDPDRPPRHFVDNPIVASLLENGCIIGLAILRNLLPRQRPERSRTARFLLHLLGGMVINDGSILVQNMLVHKVYTHIPFFSQAHTHRARLRPSSLRRWLRCNFIANIIAGGLVTLFNRRSKRPAFSLQPLRFLVKLAISRVVVDLFFYTAHRALHTPMLYKIHKKHHQHIATGLPTNFQFTLLDLLIENFAPLFAAMFTLEVVMKNGCSPLEQGLLVGYIQWYEIGSHSGKPVPTVTYFPPLTLLYRLLLGNVDERNIEFHDKHHAYGNCNYGITQWCDHLFGTSEDQVLEKDGTAAAKAQTAAIGFVRPKKIYVAW